jgi:HD-GYP domain-containing protein (c-di-GMP phosphodiesterase class II)
MLYDEIRKLFEGFVKASVEAIESRDPTTSGHSRRVADLTVELAKVVDAETSGPYKGANF